MTERKVSANWSPGPMQSMVDIEGGYQILVDEPVHAGGTDQGPQPTDLFLASIASCFTLALVYSGRKHDLSPSGINVEVIGTYDGPRFRAIEIRAHVDGVDEAGRERLVRSAERVCYVTNTLRSAPTITVSADGST